MKKRILTVLLTCLVMTAVLTLSVMAAEEVSSGDCGVFYSDNVNWSFDASTDTLTISGKGSMGEYKLPNVKPPWSHLEDRIRYVVIEPGVTSVGNHAFYSYTGYDNLAAISLPEGLKYIGEYAFVGSGLTEITIPEGVTTIADTVFLECRNLHTVRLPESLTTIGPYAFSGCTNLTTCDLPKGLKKIDDGAFNDCESLSALVLPEGLEYIGMGAFTTCSALPAITLPESLTYLGEQAFMHCSSLAEITIPGGVTEIGMETFHYCVSLTKAVIKNGVERIGEQAFYECRSLGVVEIPYTVELIDGNAFGNSPYIVNRLSEVYYGGTADGWNSIVIRGGNEPLLKAQRHYMTDCIHSFVALPAVAPTCAENGLTEGSRCTMCGDYAVKQTVIPAAGHRFDGGKCAVCGISNPFTDVKPSDWYYSTVLWAVRENVTGGTSITTFSPLNYCTRGQVVTFMWAAAGRPEPESLTNPFTDVSESDYYYKPVLWAVEQGITGGVGEGLFGPNESCTRGQIVTFLWAGQGKPAVSGSSTFKDVADTDWYAKPVIWAAENDVTGGIGEGLFGPNNTCTRGQVVTFLYKVFGQFN